MSCKLCDTLFCKECIGTLQRHDTKCPNCRKHFEQNFLNRLLKVLLEESKFACTICKGHFSYENRKTHAEKECSAFCLDCPAKCGKKVNVNSMKEHLHSECAKVQPVTRLVDQPNVMMLTD